MATEITRRYKGKDVEMLSACATIMEHAVVHKTTLVSKRANWADPFFPNLQTRIDDAFTNYLGIDNAKQMREALADMIQAEQFCPMSREEIACVNRIRKTYPAETLADIESYFRRNNIKPSPGRSQETKEQVGT